MSDTGTPTAGVENPSRFMMGLEGSADDDERFDKAVESAFSNRPPETPAEGSQVEDQGQEQGDQEGTAAPDGDTVPDPSIAGQASQGDEGEGGGQGPAGDGSPAGTSGETDTDPLALFEARWGRKPTGAEIQGLIQLADWASSLTPEQQEAVNRAVLGGGQQEPPTPEPDPLEEEIGDDPILRAIWERQQRTEAQLNQIAQANVADQQTRVIKGLEDGASRFKAQYPELTDAELTGLQSALGSARLLPGFVSAYNDPAEAMYRGLDYLYWNTPTFREREIQKQVEASKAQEQNHQQRKQKASSVTGTGGNGASRTQAPPQTPDGHWAALAQGLAEAMNNGQG